MSGGIRCFHGVATLVNQRVYLKAILLSCVQHKLPKSCGAYARYSVGVEGRLDDGQIFQL